MTTNSVSSLDAPLEGDFSLGERQLLCLARALVHKSTSRSALRILVLDEASASVDTETDALLQETVKEAFVDCTVISIARRIESVIDYDRLMVLDAGRLVDFDLPENLINNRKGFFYEQIFSCLPESTQSELLAKIFKEKTIDE